MAVLDFVPPASPGFSAARAYWNQRGMLGAKRDTITRLATAVGRAGDMRPSQWAQMMVAALEFKPTLIVELGRGYGNSTCIFTEAANQLGNCKVVSLCLSDEWQRLTEPKVRKVVGGEWFAPLDARIGNILLEDFEKIVGDNQRVLLLWDAHGYDIADYVLGYALPILHAREHLVIMHDISDTRFSDEDRSYAGHNLWRASDYTGRRVVLGHLSSAVEQCVSIADFASRNDMTLHSSDHSYHTELSEVEITELRSLGDLFAQVGDWFYFTLNELADRNRASFPAYERIGPSNLDFDPHAPLLATQESIRKLQAHIRAMEHSPFWRLRTALAPLLGRKR